MIDYTGKFKKATRGKTCIFIDAANLERSVQDMRIMKEDIDEKLKNKKGESLCWKVDYRKLKKFFEEQTKLKKITFYSAKFDNIGHDNFLAFLKKQGYELQTKSLKKYDDHTEEKPHRKANFDVEIATDSVSEMEKFQTIVLFSGDSDFKYLLNYLRSNGKITIVFSRSGHVAKELPAASNYYFDIANFRHEILKIETKKQKTPPKRDSAVDNR